jgi:hypothetical protein
MRRKPGLAPDHTTIRVSAGGFDLDPVETLIHHRPRAPASVPAGGDLRPERGAQAAARRARRSPAAAPEPRVVRGGLQDRDGRVHDGRFAGRQTRGSHELRGPRTRPRPRDRPPNPRPGGGTPTTSSRPAWQSAATTSGRSPVKSAGPRGTGPPRRDAASARRLARPHAARDIAMTTIEAGSSPYGSRSTSSQTAQRGRLPTIGLIH